MIKEIMKEIGVPRAIICNASGEQSSKEVKKFCNSTGASLNHLKEVAQYASLAELHVGLMKEAFSKGMRLSNCPLVFLDYCAE